MFIQENRKILTVRVNQFAIDHKRQGFGFNLHIFIFHIFFFIYAQPEHDLSLSPDAGFGFTKAYYCAILFGVQNRT